MGIVQRQTIRGTAWSYLGAILGFVNIILLSPRIFTTGEIGVVQLLLSFATLLAQFASLGFTNVINRLFPYFRDSEKRHHGFLGLSMVITLAGFLGALIFFRLYASHFEEVNMVRSPLISEYSFYLPALLLISLLFNLLDNYNKVLYDAVLGTFLKEFLFRVLNLILIALFWAGVIDFSGYVFGYVISQGVPLIVIFISLFIRGEISFRLERGFITPYLKREIFFLSLFGILTGISSMTLTTLDKLFINTYLGEADVGIYTIASYFAVMITLPGRSVSKISTPFLAESWKGNDIDTIRNLYVKSSISQYAVGLLIFIGLLVNLDNIYRLLPDAYSGSAAVIVLIGIGNLASVSVGVNNVILGTSALYRYQTWLMLIFIAIFVITSIILIPAMGITGAALASMISNIIYNMLGLLLAGRRFGLWPWSGVHLRMTLAALAALAAGYLMPQIALLPDIIVRSLLVTALFSVIIWRRGRSDDLDDLISTFLRRFTGKG